MDLIITLQDELMKAFSVGGFMLGIFINFECVFNMLWRNGLLYKLTNLKLTNRMIQTHVRGNLSQVVELKNGTLQGVVLSFSSLFS